MQPLGGNCRPIGVLSISNARAQISPEAIANGARSLGIAACIIPTTGDISPPATLSLRLYRLLERFVGSSHGNDPVALDSKECEEIRVAVAQEAIGALLSPIPILDACQLAMKIGVPVIYVACAFEHLGTKALEAKLRQLVRGEYRPRIELRIAAPGSKHPQSLRSASSTPVSRLSIARNDEPLTSLAPALWAHAMRLLASERFNLAAVDAPASALANPPPRWTLFSTLKLLGRHIAHRRRRTGRGESWEIGVRHRRQRGGAHIEGDGYTWLTAPPGSWYADPFVVEAYDSFFVFVEQFVIDRGKGRIVCLKLDNSLAVEEHSVVLERPYHLAYPHVFLHEGTYFMIPESGANGTIEIYRAKRFPVEWEFVSVLCQGPFFDTTVAHFQGRFWFFTSRIADQRGAAAELHLFHSDSLLGEWRSHPLSPISLDASVARSAGALFEVDGRLLRPSQDCSKVYGGGVTFHVLETLTAEGFKAVKSGAIALDDLKTIRMHTYNSSRTIEVVDRVRSC